MNIFIIEMVKPIFFASASSILLWNIGRISYQVKKY
jgi:hypothetical protein